MSRRHRVNTDGTKQVTRMQMTAQDVRLGFERALDDWNVTATKDREAALAYETEFRKQQAITDSYDAQNFMLDLVLGEKFGKHVKEFSEKLTNLMYWEGMANRYQVSEAIVSVKEDDIPYWWRMIDEEHKDNPNHMPTKGQVFDLGKSSGGSGRRRSSVVKMGGGKPT